MMLNVGSATNFLARVVILFFFVPKVIYSFRYPAIGTKRSAEPGIVHPAAYVTMPLTVKQQYSGYPEYDESYGFSRPNQEEYNFYDKYPVIFYPEEKQESYGYVEEQPEDDSILDLRDEMAEVDGRENYYPYGQEKWFEGSDAETNAAFMQNAMLAQMYPGTNPFIFSRFGENFQEDEDNDEREWSYGVPVTEVEDETNEDQSIKELESLKAKTAGRPSMIDRSKMREENRKPLTKEEILRNLRMQKENSRKVSGGLKMKKNQAYDSVMRKNMKEKFGKSSFSDRKGRVHATTSTPSTEKPTTTTTERSAKAGQKEYVLPRPANPVRRPFDQEVSRRSEGRVSVYDTIKKLLAMEDVLRKKDPPRLRKRFVLEEDQLTSELSGLKKISV